MDVGITTRCYCGISNEEAAFLIEETGFKNIELCLVQSDSNYWAYNGQSDLSDMSLERFKKITDCYRRENLEICALGVFTNNIEHDEQKRSLNNNYFIRHMELASYAGIPVVSTECGFDPLHRGIQAQYYESDFSLLKENMIYLSGFADKYNVDIAIEPCVLDVIPSAKRMRDFINQTGSNRIKVLLDPANLIANSSEEDMFTYLKDKIAYFHGKDRKVNDTYGRLLGDGDIDWPLFLSLYHKYTDGIPFVIEYPNKDTAKMTLDRVLNFDDKSNYNL